MCELFPVVRLGRTKAATQNVCAGAMSRKRLSHSPMAKVGVRLVERSKSKCCLDYSH